MRLNRHVVMLVCYLALGSSLAAAGKVAPSALKDLTGCRYEDRFYASEHVCEIFDFVMAWEGARTTTVLDFFGGQGALARYSKHVGEVPAFFDVKTNPDENICLRKGFFIALESVLSVIEWGLVVWGPPCSLWIWLSISISKRSRQKPEGHLIQGIALQKAFVRAWVQA